MLIDLVIKVVQCGPFILEERGFKGNGTGSPEEEGLDLAT